MPHPVFPYPDTLISMALVEFSSYLCGSSRASEGDTSE
uniref:Uncharacterized protein n=1 Tax=Anguilla anguilla TaxID=7936 RepID=A0A0E9QDS9_ANGAN